MNYRRLLEEGYAATCADCQGSRLEYLSDYLFEFTTYDSEMSALFASKALEVARVISERRTLDYIKDADNYRWFLLICNMPFFAKRIEWGTSIRGAWWDQGITLDSCGLWLDGEQVRETIAFTDDEWLQFIAELLQFAVRAP